jgi:cystine transport system substrate-binding protein
MTFADRLRATFLLMLLLGGPPPAAAADSLAAIRARGVLRIGLEGTYPPFGYQAENGDLVGFDVDIAKAVAARMGLAPQFLPSKWEGILAALEVQRFDVVVNQVTISDERRKVYDFSRPYTYSGLQLIVRAADADKIRGPDDLAGKRVGVLLGTNHEQWLREHAPKSDIRTYEDDATRNQELLVGRIDAVLNDRLIVGNVTRQYGGRLVATGPPILPTQQAIAVRKGSPELVAALDQALASLAADGSLARISEKWFTADVTKP